MKLVTYDAGEGPRAGALAGDVIVDLQDASEGDLPAGIVELLGAEGGLDAARTVGEAAAKIGKACGPLDQARLLAPVPHPGKIVCLGMNYREHIEEGGAEVPCEPVIFCKAATSVIGAGEPIVLPEASTMVDYEVELAFVIGRRAKLVKAEDAMDYVAGYAVLNDVSARDYQTEKPGGQWHLAKSFDTFCPLGPWLVTADEIHDPHALALSCDINGEVLQDSSTENMIFHIPEIIEYASRVFTLEPGDVFGTGTPAGVGYARTPQRFLRGGDVVRCTIEHIGTLENPVR